MKTIKELKEQRDTLLAEVEGATAERFAEIKGEIDKIDYQIKELEKREEPEQGGGEGEKRGAANPAARTPTGGVPEEGIEQRGKVVIFDGKQAQGGGEMSKEEKLLFARSALGKQIKGQLQGLKVDLSQNERRALGVAITTTSTEYKAPSGDADGVNNGGIFIPQNVLFDLLEIDTPDSPFLRDVGATHIKGAIIFPYVAEANNGQTKGKKELVASEDRSIKWEKLTLAQGNYPLTIEVTMEILAYTDAEFANYLLADLGNEINILLADEVLYGTGTDDRIEGVTVGAIKGDEYDEGGEADAIKAGLLALSRRARRGAKIYASRSLALTLAFEKDKNGAYIFPIYNNDGISSIATVPTEVDETLADGDFVIGNPKNYKLNFVKPTEIYAELQGKKRVIEYTAHLMVGGKAAPKKFYYGKKKASEAV